MVESSLAAAAQKEADLCAELEALKAQLASTQRSSSDDADLKLRIGKLVCPSGRFLVDFWSASAHLCPIPRTFLTYFFAANFLVAETQAMLAALRASLSMRSKEGVTDTLTGSDFDLANAAASHSADAQILLVRKLASADAALLAEEGDGMDGEELGTMVSSLAQEARRVMVSLEAAKQLSAQAMVAEAQAAEEPAAEAEGAEVSERVVQLLYVLPDLFAVRQFSSDCVCPPLTAPVPSVCLP